MNNKNLKSIITLFIISWAAAALFAFLFVFTQAQNVKLKKNILACTAKLGSLNMDMATYQKLKEQSQNWDKTALDFLEWQFVLKDQINTSGLRLLNEINKIRDLRHDKELANLLYYNLGLTYTMAVDFNSAIRAFEDALAVKAADPDSCYNLGLIYSTYRRDAGRAIKYYQKFLELSPKSPKAEEVKERIKALQR